MFTHLLVGLKVKVKYDHSCLGLRAGKIGEIVEVEHNDKYAPNIYVKFGKKKFGFMAYEVERVK